MNPQDITPEDCSEPFWHDTHRYCPACSWTEDYDKTDDEKVAEYVAKHQPMREVATEAMKNTNGYERLMELVPAENHVEAHLAVLGMAYAAADAVREAMEV